MENIFPTLLLDLLVISVTVSIVVMSTIQKFKTLSFITKDWHVWFLNLLFSFIIGIPFAVFFYNLELIEGLWIALFSFIGAPTLYDALKNQTIINYKPTSLDDKLEEIKRD